MNELNLLESQLRSWRPRRPSPALKLRIFAARVHDRGAHKVMVWSLRCLAPATACLLLAAAAFNHGNNLSTVSHPDLLGMVGSNQLAYPQVSYPQEGNKVPAATLGWTNRSGSTSSISPISPGRVN